MMKKIGAFLAVLMLLFSTGCSWTVPVELSDEDLVSILKILAEETAPHRLTEEAEKGRLIVFGVGSFDVERIQGFIQWAEDEYNHPPNALVILTSDDKDDVFTEDDAVEALGDLYTEDAFSEWTNYSFEMLEYSGRGKQTCTFEVGVLFPNHDLVGAGNAYVLEKNGSAWEIVDYYMTWIA